MTQQASSGDHTGRIIVAGFYATGSGYPNGGVTQQVLERSGYHVVDLGRPMPASARLWKTAQGSLPGVVKAAFRFFAHNLGSVLRVLAQASREDLVYVRYPGVLFMFFMSFVPVRWRPKCQLEAFISIWDAAFVDRATDKAWRQRLGPLILALEGRAMRAADMVIVDTTANARFVERYFGVKSDRVRAIPLGVDEEAWENARPVEKSAFTVLFVGTFVPLHGIDVICSAMERIGGNQGIRFVIIGDGQGAPTLRSFVESHPEVDIEWRREWMSARELAANVSAADVCLGVFGGEGKASRVLPYKLYMYLCLGKAFITQADLSTPDGVPRPPAEYVAGRSADALADAILKLRTSHEARQSLERDARAFFERYLSNASLADAWTMLATRDGSPL